MPQETPWPAFQVSLGRTVFAQQFASGRTVLEVGCGYGYSTSLLAHAGARQAIGLDIEATSTHYAQEHYAGDCGGPAFVQGDAHRLPFRDSSIAVVVCLETIEHLDGPHQFLSECRRVLVQGGLLICSTPNRNLNSLSIWPRPLDPAHVREFSLAEFRDLLDAEFEEVTLYGQLPLTTGETLRHKLSLLGLRLAREILKRIPGGSTFKAWGNGLRGQLDAAPRNENSYAALDLRYKVLPLNAMARAPLVVLAVARRGAD